MLLTVVLRCTSRLCFGNRSIVKPATQYETAYANLRANRVSRVDSGLRIRIEVHYQGIAHRLLTLPFGVIK